MNIPTWLIVAASVIYTLWSYVEIGAVVNAPKLRRQGYKVVYSALSLTVSVIWVIISVLLLCYVIFG